MIKMTKKERVIAAINREEVEDDKDDKKRTSNSCNK